MLRVKEADFTIDTRVVPMAGKEHHYICELTEAWNAPTIPFGGLLSAIAVRAMQTDLADPQQRIRTVTTTFASQITAGTLAIEVERLRVGRTASQMLARVRRIGDDGPGHVTTAV